MFAIHRTFDGLTDWKLFQRGPMDDAPIPVRFGYVSNVAVRVEVRVVDRDTGTPLPGFDFADQLLNGRSTFVMGKYKLINLLGRRGIGFTGPRTWAHASPAPPPAPRRRPRSRR